MPPVALMTESGSTPPPSLPGIYNLTEPEMARRLLARQVGHLQATGAEVVVTANPGCIPQLAAGLRERGVPAQVLHIVEPLDQAYAAAESADG